MPNNTPGSTYGSQNPLQARGVCHNCRQADLAVGDTWAVGSVIGTVNAPYPRKLWQAQYSAQGKLCKPCANAIAQEKNARGDRV